MEFKIEKDKGVVKVKIVEDFIETAMTREVHSNFDKGRVRKVLEEILIG